MLFEHGPWGFSIDGELHEKEDFSHMSSALWIEGADDLLGSEFVPNNNPVLVWAKTGAQDWTSAVKPLKRIAAVYFWIGTFSAALTVVLLGMALYLPFFIAFVLINGFNTIIMYLAAVDDYRCYRRARRAFKSGQISVAQLDPDLVNAVRSLLESNLHAEVCRAFEKRHDEIPRCKRVVNIDKDSISRVIAQNPALAELLSKELNAELPSPPEYRRSALNTLYKCIQTEIDRLTTNKRILEEQQTLEDGRRKMEEDLRRTREERNALATAEADRMSRILALPSILGESKEEVEMFGRISQEMCELGSQDSTRVASEQA